MRSYPALSTIAGIIKVIAFLVGAVGVVGAIATMAMGDGTEAMVTGLVMLAALAGYCIVLWAFSELISLLVNLGVDVSVLRTMVEKTEGEVAASTSEDEEFDPMRVEHAGWVYVPIEDAEGTAFCKGCRTVVQKADLLFCRENDTYYHAACLQTAKQASS